MQFLNNECQIEYNCFTDKESKKLTWHDLTEQEKVILKILLFSDHQQKDKIQELWTEFYSYIGGRTVMQQILEKQANLWITIFTAQL